MLRCTPLIGHSNPARSPACPPLAGRGYTGGVGGDAGGAKIVKTGSKPELNAISNWFRRIFPHFTAQFEANEAHTRASSTAYGNNTGAHQRHNRSEQGDHVRRRRYRGRDDVMVTPGKMAEREGFEPPEPRGSTVFKTAAIDHSATSPMASNSGQRGISAISALQRLTLLSCLRDKRG